MKKSNNKKNMFMTVNEHGQVFVFKRNIANDIATCKGEPTVFKLTPASLDFVHNGGIPHEVTGYIMKKGYTPQKAWRRYLGLSVKQAAKLIKEVFVEDLLILEKAKTLSKDEYQKIADAYDVPVKHINLE